MMVVVAHVTGLPLSSSLLSLSMSSSSCVRRTPVIMRRRAMNVDNEPKRKCSQVEWLTKSAWSPFFFCFPAVSTIQLQHKPSSKRRSHRHIWSLLVRYARCKSDKKKIVNNQTHKKISTTIHHEAAWRRQTTANTWYFKNRNFSPIEKQQPKNIRVFYGPTDQPKYTNSDFGANGACIANLFSFYRALVCVFVCAHGNGGRGAYQAFYWHAPLPKIASGSLQLVPPVCSVCICLY